MFREVRPLRLLWVVHSLHHMRVLRLLNEARRGGSRFSELRVPGCRNAGVY
jgi:hypothetical protein